MSKPAKYVLCIPLDGINDMLGSISRCWDYCERFNRILIVDTNSGSFCHHFDAYFQPIEDNGRVFFRLDSNLKDRLKDLSVFPSQLQGRIFSHTRVARDGFWRDELTNTPLLFNPDAKVDYKEDVLLYEQGYGSGDAIGALKRMKFSESIKKIINERLHQVKTPYSSIHIRYSDIKTNFKELLVEIKEELKDKNVLISSDSLDVRNFAINFLNSSYVFTVTDIPNVNGGALHSPQTFKNFNLDPFFMNTNAIVDLVALSGGSKLYFSQTAFRNDGVSVRPKPSGFSTLANALNKNQNVIHNLLL